MVNSPLAVIIPSIIWLFTGIIWGYSIRNTHYESLIKECEQNLPRTVTCKIIAVEETK